VTLPARRIDWVRVRELARTSARRGQRVWSNLTPQEREELWALVKRSGGDPRRLTREETKRIGRLLARALR
jgi:hypothetical protein